MLVFEKKINHKMCGSSKSHSRHYKATNIKSRGSSREINGCKNLTPVKI